MELIGVQQNVTKAFTFQEEPPLILMDFYASGNLAQAEGMTEDLYMTAFAQILSGPEHLHNNDIVHRDPKPENILIATWSVFTVVITDFGLANAVSDNRLLNTQCGTPVYAVPEILGVSGHGLKVDTWSLGVMALEWIYGLPGRPDYE